MGSGNNQQKMLKPIVKEEFYNGIVWNQLINLSTTKNGRTRHYVCNTKYTAKSVEYFKFKKKKKQKKNPEPKSSQVSHHQFSGKRE